MHGGRVLWFVVGAGAGIAVLLAAQHWRHGPRTLPQVTAETLRSVVRIDTLSGNGEKEGYGTGFLIGPGLVATNFHVVDSGAQLQVTTADGRIIEGRELVCADEEADVAVIRLAEEPDLPALPLMKDVDDAKSGVRIMVAGTPGGYDGTVTEGVVSSVRTRKAGSRIISELQISAAISPGSSGSPVVIQETGEVAGIATRTTKQQLVNFAASSASLKLVMEAGAMSDGLPEWANAALRELNGDPVAKRYLDDGFAAVKSGRPREAFELADRLIARFPANAQAQRLAGVARFDAGLASQAIPFFRKAAAAEPRLSTNWMNLTLALGRAGDFFRAAETAAELRKLLPWDAEPLAVHAVMLLKSGDKEAAALEKEIRTHFDPEANLEAALKSLNLP
jgi:hypothetical protein